MTVMDVLIDQLIARHPTTHKVSPKLPCSSEDLIHAQFNKYTKKLHQKLYTVCIGGKTYKLDSGGQNESHVDSQKMHLQNPVTTRSALPVLPVPVSSYKAPNV